MRSATGVWIMLLIVGLSSMAHPTAYP
jgi:hypothetical protein